MIRRPPRSTLSSSSAASDVYKRQDVYGHSVPDLLGLAEDEGPTALEDVNLLLPVDTQGIKVISVGMMKPSRDQVVAWRGPILDRAHETPEHLVCRLLLE